jgi:hypothetical protein
LQQSRSYRGCQPLDHIFRIRHQLGSPLNKQVRRKAYMLHSVARQPECLPNSLAGRAVISDPLYCFPSTMMTPIGIPAMMGFILLQFVHGAS